MTQDSSPKQWTCGMGLTAHARVPAKIAEFLTALAENLEAHIPTIDTSEPDGRTEHAAYVRLAEEYGALGARLAVTAEQMHGYRDLPAAPHHEAELADAAFCCATGRPPSRRVRVEQGRRRRVGRAARPGRSTEPTTKGGYCLMPRIEESIVISRPCAEVFTYLENRAHDPEWMVSVVESQWLDRGSADSDPGAAIGRRGRMVMTIQGKPTEFIDEVTDYEPGRRVAHRTVEGPIPLNTACLCEPVEGGCKATVVGEADRLKPGILGRLIEPFIARSIRRGFKADLQRLKEIVEGGPAD